MVNADQAGLSEEKQARHELRTAIERRDEKTAALAEAVRAVNAAELRGRELNRELARLVREDARDDGAELVDALLAGRGDGGVAVLADRGAKTQRIRAELKTLANAGDRLERIRSDRANSAVLAEEAVRSSARKVLASSGVAEELMDGLAEMEAEIIRRRSSLSALLRHLQGERAADEVVKQAMPLFRSVVLPTLGAVHPSFAQVVGAAEARWSSTIEGLSRDADAVVNADGPIPTFEPRPQLQLQPQRSSLADPVT